MCGFAALFEPGRLFDVHLLDRIDQDLFHRGPDSGGRLSQPGVALVFRRLAILDPRAGADQPMSDATGALTLVFNGEIYNYRELRSDLESRGHTFRTTGDTEVLLHGYAEWGKDVLDRLEGMFAFCIVNRRRGEAVLARDHFGIKPLYVCEAGGLFAAASEMRPLRRLVATEPDPAALAELLAYGWAAGDRSNLLGIRRVAPGTAITVPLAGGRSSTTRYFDVLDTLRDGGEDEADARDIDGRIETELARSVKGHLVSDVGYTLQLSGGVDSSLVAALARRNTERTLHSYSVSLGSHRLDERQYRAPVIERYELEHHELEIDGKAFADALPRAVSHMEGPPPHGACVTLMLLCDKMREVSKVVLTGEGADEFFGGYDRYQTWQMMQWKSRIARLVPAASLPDIWPFRGIRRLGGGDAPALAALYGDRTRLEQIFPDLPLGAREIGGSRVAASQRFKDYRSRLFAVDQTSYLESLLVRQDKMSMAASVEARVPFVHLPLVRAANTLARSAHLSGGEPKAILKRVAARYLPRDVVYRRKMGLLLPYGEWLQNESGLGRYLADLAASDAPLASYADRTELRSCIDAGRSGTPIALQLLTRLVFVDQWLRSLKSDGIFPGSRHSL